MDLNQPGIAIPSWMNGGAIGSPAGMPAPAMPTGGPAWSSQAWSTNASDYGGGAQFAPGGGYMLDASQTPTPGAPYGGGSPINPENIAAMMGTSGFQSQYKNFYQPYTPQMTRTAVNQATVAPSLYEFLDQTQANNGASVNSPDAVYRAAMAAAGVQGQNQSMRAMIPLQHQVANAGALASQQNAMENEALSLSRLGQQNFISEQNFDQANRSRILDLISPFMQAMNGWAA